MPEGMREKSRKKYAELAVASREGDGGPAAGLRADGPGDPYGGHRGGTRQGPRPRPFRPARGRVARAGGAQRAAVSGGFRAGPGGAVQERRRCRGRGVQSGPGGRRRGPGTPDPRMTCAVPPRRGAGKRGRSSHRMRGTAPPWCPGRAGPHAVYMNALCRFTRRRSVP